MEWLEISMNFMIVLILKLFCQSLSKRLIHLNCLNLVYGMVYSIFWVMGDQNHEYTILDL